MLLGFGSYSTRRYDDVIRELTGQALLNAWAHALLVGAYAHLGRTDEAKSVLKMFIKERCRELAVRNRPAEADTIAVLARGLDQSFRLATDREHFREGLLKAGLPG